MSKLAEQARDAAREKVERLTRTPKGDVDASGWREPVGEQGLQSGVQTGPRPVSRRQFRRGGKVHGTATKNAGRKPRASGGMTAKEYLNRDVKSANESREGPKHVGGMKKGGRAHKFLGGGMIQNPNLGAAPGAQVGQPAPVQNTPVSRPALMGNQNMRPGMRPFASGGHVSDCKCKRCMGGRAAKAAGGASYGGTRPQGGRIARKHGGRSKKGGTNVNIIIAPPQPKPAMPPPGLAPPPGGPVGMHQGAPPPMPPPGAGAPPPMGPPPMMRKSGGRTGYPLKDGSGGGKGRLQKIAAYG